MRALTVCALGWRVDHISAKRGGVLLIIAQTNGDTVTCDHSTSAVQRWLLCYLLDKDSGVGKTSGGQVGVCLVFFFLPSNTWSARSIHLSGTVCFLLQV